MAVRRTVRTHTASGTFSYPATTVNDARAQCTATGGGGTLNVGAGGGGAYAESVITTPAASSSYDVVAVTGAANADGGDCSYAPAGQAATVVAKGGKSGLNGGAGGAAAASTGTIKQSGGAGLQAIGGTDAGGGAGGGGLPDGSGSGDGGAGGSGNANGGDGGGVTGARGTGGNGTGNAPGGAGRAVVGSGTAGGRGNVRVSFDETVTEPNARLVDMCERRSAANSTAPVVAFPRAAVKERVTIVASSDGNPTLSIADGTWEKINQQSAPDNSSTIAVFTKYCLVSESTVTLAVSATEEVTAHVLITQGTAKPEATFSNGAAGANPNPGGHTRADAVSRACMWVTSLSTDNVTSGSDVTAPPSGWDCWWHTPTRNVAGTNLSTAIKYSTAAAEDPGAWTSADAATAWAAVTLSFATEIQVIGAGSFDVTGSGSTVETIAVSGAGSFNVVGSGSIVETIAINGAGSFEVNGSGSIVEALTVNGAGSFEVNGSGSVVETVEVSGVGSFDVEGSGSIVETVNVTGAGSFDVEGSGSVVETIAINGSGSIEITGAGAIAARSVTNSVAVPSEVRSVNIEREARTALDVTL